jgi:subtilisin family serine protease
MGENEMKKTTRICALMIVLATVLHGPAALQPEEPYDGVVVLSQIEEPGDGGVTNRITLAEDVDFKYPNLRIEEEVLDGTNVLSQSVVVADHITVMLKPGKTQADLVTLNTQLGGSIRSVVVAPDLYLVAFTNATLDTVSDAVLAYQAATNTVLYAGPDAVFHTTSTFPNDPSFTNLWGLHNTGQAGGTSDADIDAPEAWDISTGSGVVVAVLDSGIDYNHEDLSANMWSNTNEIAGNGIDDDSNGYIDDIYGYDGYNEDGDPMGDNDHGTHCAGTIAAVGNNATGVVGVAWQAKLIALKGLSSGGGGTASAQIRCLNYLKTIVQAGVDVRVVSASFGDLGEAYNDYPFRLKIRELGSLGVLFVSGAGNDGIDLGDRGINFYPACYDEDNIIAVAAVDRYGIMSGFSNYGKDRIDLAAPGEEIWSTVLGNGYYKYGGTSMATPHVAGVAALLFSHSPSATVARVKRALIDGADPMSVPLCGKTVSDGSVNAATSLALLAAVAAPLFDPPGGFYDTNAVSVTIESLTPGATVYYTTNGTTPDQTSAAYTGPVDVPMGTALKASAYLTGQTNSRVKAAEYDWPLARAKHWALNSDPGWTTNGLWEFGVPLGGGTSGGRDPSYVTTGNNVYGYNLAGDYEKGITNALTTLAIDCSNFTKTQLRFRRWLTLDSGDSSIQMSTDGSSWTDVWGVKDYYGNTVRDTSWKLRQYDISSVADGQSTVYIRWVMGPISNESWTDTWGGWNIDDIEIWSSVALPLTHSEPSWAF